MAFLSVSPNMGKPSCEVKYIIRNIILVAGLIKACVLRQDAGRERRGNSDIARTTVKLLMRAISASVSHSVPAVLAATLLSLWVSDRAWAPTMQEYAVIFILNRSACTVVDRELTPNEKMIAGPFASREEALNAMKRAPECQSSKK
jgi:hypothetical protein